MISVSSFSEVGDNAHNEDAFVVWHHATDTNVIACFVADGQGGRSGGRRAADLACQTALDKVAMLPLSRLKDRRSWVGLLRELDEAVSHDESAGLTTFVGLCLVGDSVVGASCGDSAALFVTGKGIVELTKNQHKNPPIGSGAARPESFEMSCDVTGRLLVMTDGVWKYVGWPVLIEMVQRERGDALIAELQQAARLPGSGRFQDDFTVVLLEGAD